MASRDRESRRLTRIATHTIEQVTDKARPAFRHQDPRPIGERRNMADVLPVPAGEHRHPVTHFVLSPTNDRAQH